MQPALFLLALMGLFHVVLSGNPIEANPDGSGKPAVDPSSVGLQNVYCQQPNKLCTAGSVLSSKFASTLQACVQRCSGDLKCLHLDYSTSKTCSLRGSRCENGPFKTEQGAFSIYRLKVGESCPAHWPQYKAVNVKYSNFYCMAWGKTCVGHNLYKKPLSIQGYENCLKKCSKNRACAMVDYYENGGKGQCQPKEYQCSDDEIQTNGNVRNFLRLPIGQEGSCPGDRVPPSPTRPPPPPPTQPPPPPPTQPPPPPPTQPPPPPPTQPPPPANPCAPSDTDGCLCKNTLKAASIIKTAGGEVFQAMADRRKCGKYRFVNIAMAAQACQVLGGRLASYGQVSAAHKLGLDFCGCGYVIGGKAYYSIQTTRTRGCKGSGLKLNECLPRFFGRWGGPGWNAWCIR